MKARRSLVLTLLSATLLGSGAADASWRHIAGDPQATARHTDSVGDFGEDPEDRPGVTWALALPSAELGAATAADVDGDGSSDLLTLARGRLVALSGTTGSLLWISGSFGLTEIVGLGDLDGISGTLEAVVSSHWMGGGVGVFDVATGALRHFSGDLDQGSGVLAKETRLADVDGDGALEAFWGLRLNGSAELVALDLSTPDGEAREVRVSLGGSYFGITQPTLGDFDGDGLQDDIAIVAGTDLDRWSFCAPAAEDATCDEIDGSFCLCPHGFVTGLWAQWIFPEFPEAADLDADGIDEIVLDHRHPTFPLEGFGVIEPWEDTALGVGTPSIGAPWYYRFGDSTMPIAGVSTLGDFDGGGSFEVALTMWNDGVGEQGVQGEDVDDGIDLPGAFTVGLWSAATGSLLASADDRLLLGWEDLDHDGVVELVVATTAGDGLAPLGIEGLQLSCAGPDACGLATVWSTTAHGAFRDSGSLGADQLPEIVLRVAGQGLDTRLITYDGDDVVSLGTDGLGGVTEFGRITLAEDDEVLTIGAFGVVLLQGGEPSLLSPDLGSGVPLALPPSLVAPWLSVPLPEGRDLTVFDDRVYDGTTSPLGLDSALGRLLRHPVLVVDLDGDGASEVISWEIDDGDGLLRIAAHTVTSTAVTPLWLFDTNSEPALGTEAPRQAWPFTHDDLDGDGVQDVVLAIGAGSNGSLVVLSGTSGSLIQRIVTPGIEGYWAPLLTSDLIDGAGALAPDGTPDIVVPSFRHLGIYDGLGGGALVEVTTSFWNFSALFADLDGNGDPEALLFQSFALAGPALEAWSFTDGFSRLWGPLDAGGPPPDVPLAVAVADIDDAPGLDPVYITADGAIHARSGVDGALLPGFPIGIVGGEVVDPEGEGEASPATALVVADLDGDGGDDALVGSREGWLYAINLSTSPPALLWSFRIGEEITRLGLADVDGDGLIEILVSSLDGVGRILDATGVGLEISTPEQGACIGTGSLEVRGSSVGVETVNIRVGGGDPTLAELEPSGDWVAQVPFTLSPGLTQITAEGRVGEVVAVSAAVSVESEWDADDDGTTTCGGDCAPDDPAIHPAAEELCDGIDNDCDPSTDEGVDGDGDSVSICGGDCDDDDGSVGPSLAEHCDGGIDEDCDGEIDADDSDCAEDPTPEPTPDPVPTPGGGCVTVGCSIPGASTGRQSLGAGGVLALALAASAGWRRRRGAGPAGLTPRCSRR